MCKSRTYMWLRWQQWRIIYEQLPGLVARQLLLEWLAHVLPKSAPVASFSFILCIFQSFCSGFLNPLCKTVKMFMQQRTRCLIGLQLATQKGTLHTSPLNLLELSYFPKHIRHVWAWWYSEPALAICWVFGLRSQLFLVTHFSVDYWQFFRGYLTQTVKQRDWDIKTEIWDT